MRRILILGVILVITLAMGAPAFAVPTLQLYIEGSEYDIATDTWVTTSPEFILWILGDVGSYGTITDVKLAAAYESSEIGSISLIPTTATSGLLPSPGDPSTPAIPSFFASGSGSAPLMGNGNPLPSHGIYGPGTSWTSYSTGDFTLTDSPIGDYIQGGCPDGSCFYPSSGQINAYSVSISGYSWVHFDAYNHIVLNNNHLKYRFAPFSHDAEFVPEPATLLLLGSGLLGLAAFGRMRRKRGGFW